MNNTKWEQLRVAMIELDGFRPQWRAKDLSGFVSSWDGEWYYHFRDGGYASIEWVEIRVNSPDQDGAVATALRRVHVPGRRIENGFRVYGYANDGEAIDYL
jgi:hypothetical protein